MMGYLHECNFYCKPPQRHGDVVYCDDANPAPDILETQVRMLFAWEWPGYVVKSLEEVHEASDHVPGWKKFAPHRYLAIWELAQGDRVK